MSEKNDEKAKIMVPGEGDVISGGGLSSGKHVIESISKDAPGIKTVTVRKLASDGSYDTSIKKEEFIITDEANKLEIKELKFYNKMKKQFIKKGK